MLRAVQLEAHLSKREILTLYLERAPFGGTIEGVDAASWAYLGKPASRLSHAEAALLSVLPQSPSRLRPDRHPDAARSARAMGRLLDSAAGREAVQSAARQGLVRPQIHAQREDPLASGMREAAQGDCMKGEFKGGGMGLLSLPMLAAAALKGECSR